MAANKPGKAEILAAFFDDGTYSPLFTDGAVSAAYGCANGQNAYVVFSVLFSTIPADCYKAARTFWLKYSRRSPPPWPGR